jgi:nucleotide-binding universal stress UspA family protein
MKVVLGLDSSTSSRVAHDVVTDVTWPHGTQFILVTAFDSSEGWLSHAPGGSRPDLLDVLDVMAEPIRRAGHVAEVRAEHGPVGRTLRDIASAEGADLIIVGSRGRGVAASALGGSVSADLTDHAPCPVFIARRPTLSRILVATDGSASAVAIPGILARWQILRGLPVHVLSVARRPAASTDFLVTAWAPTPEVGHPEKDDDVIRHHRYADEMAERLSEAGWDASSLLRIGDPARQIIEASEELGCDLVVTGSRGLGDMKRLLLGSVAHDVLLHSHCSVLVLRGHVPARRAVREPALALKTALPA